MALDPECIKKALEAAGKELSSKDMEALLGQFQKRIEKKLGIGGNAGRETLDIKAMEVAKDFADEVKQAAAIVKRQKIINVFAERYRKDIISQLPNDPALAVTALNVGINKPIKGGRLSVDARQKAVRAKLTGSLISEMRKAGVLDFFQKSDAAFDKLVARELWEIDRTGGKPGITGVPEAKTIAETIAKVQEASRRMQNDAGGYIRKMQGYIVAQSHDMVKILRAGYEQWKNDVLPGLDERTFDDVNDREKFLHGVYDALVTGKHLKPDSMNEDTAPRLGISNVASRLSQSRVLHFKDADSWWGYNQKYGRGPMREAVLHGLMRAGDNIGLMQVWGTNPRDAFNKTIENLKVEKRNDPKAFKKVNSLSLQNQFAAVDGSMNIAGNQTLASIGKGVRAWQSMAKLGGAVVSSVTDMATVGAEFRYQTGSFLEGWSKAMQARFESVPKAARAETTDLIGTGLDGMLGSIFRRFDAQDSTPGTMSKLLTTFFKYNGLTWWTDSLKDGVGSIMARDLANSADRAHAELGEDLRRNLGMYGINAKEWDALRPYVKNVEEDGRAYMTPDVAQQISKADIEKYRGAEKLSDEQVRRTRDELEQKLRTYFTDRVDYAVTTADAREQAILLQGTRPGTAIGEAVRFVMQFKSFPAAFITKQWGREIYGKGAANWYKGDLRGLSAMILATTAMGYLAMSAKDILKGRNPRDPKNFSTWVASFTQGGGAGIFGDFIFGQYNRFGQSALEMAAGPTLSSVAGGQNSLLSLWSAARDGNDPSAQTLRFVQNNTPFINLFYVRMALDYAILYDLQEAVNPGSLRRMESQMKKNNNQVMAFPPSQDRLRPITGN